MDHLPDWYADFYRRNLESYKPDQNDIDIDDLGETLLDDNGLIRLPPTFEESMSRHRHYNWDITFVTPEIKNIPMDVRGCAELAIHHKSKDSVFFTKRKPRLFEHDPKSTSVKPTKDDYTTTKKVPVAVHLLYKSTVTGKTTKSGAASNPFTSFKFIAVLVVLIGALSGLGVTLYDIFTRDSQDKLQANQARVESLKADSTTQDTAEATAQTQTQTVVTDQVHSGQTLNVHRGVTDSAPHIPRFDNGAIEAPSSVWPYPVTKLFVSAVSVRVDHPNTYTTILFKQVYEDGTEGYVNSKLLKKLGYQFEVMDYCLVNVTYQTDSKLIVCDSRSTEHIEMETANNEIVEEAPITEPLDPVLPIEI